MERRQHPRKPVNFSTALNYPPLGLLQTRVRNISSNGALVHSGTIRLNLNSEVEFVSCINNQLNTIRARVVRITQDGAALNFIDTDPKTLRHLQSMLTTINMDTTIHKVAAKDRS